MKFGSCELRQKSALASLKTKFAILTLLWVYFPKFIQNSIWNETILLKKYKKMTVQSCQTYNWIFCFHNLVPYNLWNFIWYPLLSSLLFSPTVDDWDMYQAILDHTYKNHIRSDSSLHPVLMSEPPVSYYLVFISSNGKCCYQTAHPLKSLGVVKLENKGIAFGALCVSAVVWYNTCTSHNSHYFDWNSEPEWTCRINPQAVHTREKWFTHVILDYRYTNRF